MKALGMVATERLVELTKTLVSIPSETGKEQAIAGWLVGFLKKCIEKCTRSLQHKL